ncbi:MULTISPECIES: NlpC/P60 family protein [unclassified Adlercreutzia]|uniref:coiled-coil domain-containing protein n=1 Tax=unclassified Adlercreutzia TaxID=2636013 RepID=UPI0013EE27F3|nr:MULTISPECIES: NlpC/P60 family protein [unclassified Adlercreutzia]
MSEHFSAVTRRTFLGSAAVFGAATCTLALNPLTALAAPTAAEKQAEAAATLDKLNAMQTQLDVASNDYFTALAEQEAAQEKMDEAQARIDEANGQIADLQDKLGTRARSMYRTGSLSFIDLLLGSTTFQAFTNNWDLLNSMNENDANMVQQTKDLRAEVEAQKATYAEQERIAAEQAETARQVKEQAEATVAEMQAVYDNLSAEAAELLEQEREAQRRAEEAAAASVVQQAIEQASRPSNNGNSGGGGNVSSAPTYVPADAGSVVGRAQSYVGNAQYVWGACAPGQFDCSGFVSYCLTGAYSRLGTTYTFLGWPRVSDPQPGDVAVNADHCGIYVGNNQMIHAATEGVGVIYGPVQAGMVFVRY